MHARIINKKVVEYPIINLRQHLPNYSLPEDLSNDSTLPEGFVCVLSTQPPDYNNKTHKLVETNPIFVEGRWRANYIIQELDTEELAASIERESALVRAQRDRLLAESDWTQLPGSPVDQKVWAEYRESLRNITNQSKFPLNVEWPNKPPK